MERTGPRMGQSSSSKQRWKQNSGLVIWNLASTPEKLLGFGRGLTPATISSPVKWDRLVGFAPFATKEPFHHFSPVDSLFRKEKFVTASNSIHSVVIAEFKNDTLLIRTFISTS